MDGYTEDECSRHNRVGSKCKGAEVGVYLALLRHSKRPVWLEKSK